MGLEDIFVGASKTANVDARDVSFTVDPSHCTGSVLVFQDDGTGSGEVRVILQEEKHEFFTRAGSNLNHTTSISVLDALVGCSVGVKTLGGKTINIPVSDIVSPGYTKTIPGEGLPTGGGENGDLVLHFDIVFPKTLLPKKMIAVQEKALITTKNAFDL